MERIVYLDPREKYRQNAKVRLDRYGACGNDMVLLSSGRAAEGFILDTIQDRNPGMQRRALIPPYTCHTVIEPFMKRNYCVSCYSIGLELKTEPDAFRNALLHSRASVVLFHRYFGFDTFSRCREVIEEFLEKGVVFIEDKTHCLYSNVNDFPVDYYTGSLRKWTGVLDGGYALCREGMFQNRPVVTDKEHEKTRLSASHLKYEYMAKGEGKKEDFLEQYQSAEKMLGAQKEYYKISLVSESIQASLDVEWMRNKRRANYRTVYQRLKGIRTLKILTGELAEGVTPLYLAVIHPNRDALQKALREEAIYAPVVWPRPSSLPPVCKEADEIYQNVLCFPIDQRYDVDDMQRMADCIIRNA